MPLIISERLSRNQRLMNALQGILQEHKVHVSQSVLFDLGFTEPGGPPTLAVCLFDASDVLFEVAERLQKLQCCFARAVCIGAVSSEEKWSQLQCSIKPDKSRGSIRMIRVGSSPVAVFVALRTLLDSMNNVKTTMQQAFFETDQERIESSAVASGIAHTALAKMGVSHQDSSLLLDGLGSIKSLATMNLCGSRVRQSLPVDSEVLQCVQAYFQEQHV